MIAPADREADLAARLARARRLLDLLRDADRPKPPYSRVVFGAHEHGYALPAPVDEPALAAFERAHGVTLPDDHRAWLTRMSDGGAGPYYGLRRLADAVEPRALMPQHHVVASDADGNVLARAGTSPRPVLARRSEIGRPFPFDSAWWPLEDGFSVPDGANPYDGTLVLADQGCGMLSLLVVSGARRGEVWADSTAEEGGFAPEAPSFLAWIEAWLEAALVEWATKAAISFLGDAPVPAAIAEAWPLLERRASLGHEESWAALAYLRAREGRTEGALAAAEEMARVAEAEPERRRRVVRSRIFRAAGDVAAWLAEADAGLAISEGWASTRTELLRERLAALQAARRDDEAEVALEALALDDVWTLASQHAYARSRIRRGDVAGAIRRLEQTLHQTAVHIVDRAARPAYVFGPLAEALERDGEHDAADAIRAARAAREAALGAEAPEQGEA